MSLGVSAMEKQCRDVARYDTGPDTYFWERFFLFCCGWSLGPSTSTGRYSQHKDQSKIKAKLEDFQEPTVYVTVKGENNVKRRRYVKWHNYVLIEEISGGIVRNVKYHPIYDGRWRSKRRWGLKMFSRFMPTRAEKLHYQTSGMCILLEDRFMPARSSRDWERNDLTSYCPISK
jgi:hypothetical protein